MTTTAVYIIVNGFLLNSRPPILRAKWVSFCIIATSDLSRADLFNDLRYLEKPSVAQGTDQIRQSPLEISITRRSNEDRERLVRAQFSSLYLTDAIRETAIGAYFSLHPEILSAAIGGMDFKYEVELAWQSKDQQPIKPDMFVQRQDGFWDICDLKTALLMEQLLTTGAPARTRFKEIVQDGIAQLSNYAAYFEDPLNAAYAETKCGIKVRDPQLILIVGNRDNLPESELRQACRNHPVNFHILDYDTVASLYENRSSN